MLITHQVEQGSPEWHALRAGKVTASNAAVLLAKGKKAATATQEPSSGGYWAERGHILEKEAIEIYEAVYGVKTKEVGFITNTNYPGTGYSPDNLDGKMPLEIKCFKKEKHLACLEDTPIEVYAQVQFGLMVAGQPKARLIHYNPDIEDSALCFEVIEVPKDERLIERFKVALAK